MLYWLPVFIARIIMSMTVRVRTLGRAQTRRRGGCVLAVAHISHLDPICASLVLPRKIHWIARIEFFGRWWTRLMLWAVDAIPIDRFGVSLGAVKESIRRARRGEVVGIFPEGELAHGAASITRGGKFKRGACVIARHARCPIVPCLVIGTEKLNRVEPWLPFLRARIWVACGPPIEPVRAGNSRQAREATALLLERAFTGLFAEARREFELPESIVP